jgi:hypothetical protein
MPNLTFIIPIKIDSEIRFKNIQNTLKYLLKHTDANVHLYEADEEQKFNDKIVIDPRIKYEYHNSPSTEFHRTRIINEMISQCDTPVVANYDADVLLPVDSYKIAEKLILNNTADVVYPYGFEQFDQIKVSPMEQIHGNFSNSLDLQSIDPKHMSIGFCRFGHVQFFNTKVYKNGYMENENYLHWCPEDEERGNRFQKLGYKVLWFRSLVFHQEHPPSTLSEPKNKKEIYDLHEELMKMNKQDLINYYSKQEYLKKYATT